MCLCSSCSANSIGILFVHSWKNVPKSETNFWKQCIITEQWNTVMTPNFAHKIVHSSAMYYQNLIMIHECSKKLLKHLVHIGITGCDYCCATFSCGKNKRPTFIFKCQSWLLVRGNYYFDTPEEVERNIVVKQPGAVIIDASSRYLKRICKEPPVSRLISKSKALFSPLHCSCLRSFVKLLFGGFAKRRHE